MASSDKKIVISPFGKYQLILPSRTKKTAELYFTDNKKLILVINSILFDGFCHFLLRNSVQWLIYQEEQGSQTFLHLESREFYKFKDNLFLWKNIIPNKDKNKDKDASILAIIGSVCNNLNGSKMIKFFRFATEPLIKCVEITSLDIDGVRVHLLDDPMTAHWNEDGTFTHYLTTNWCKIFSKSIDQLTDKEKNSLHALNDVEYCESFERIVNQVSILKYENNQMITINVTRKENPKQ